MASSIPRSRLLELTKLQTSLFSHTFNPSQTRLGSKVLRARLRGPAIAAWYPRKSSTIETMLHTFKNKFGLDGYDEEALYREEGIAIQKLRGKGPPKKIRSKDEGAGKKKKKGGKR